MIFQSAISVNTLEITIFINYGQMQLQTFSYLDENTLFPSAASPEIYSSRVVAMETNAHNLKFLEGPELQR